MTLVQVSLSLSHTHTHTNFCFLCVHVIPKFVVTYSTNFAFLAICDVSLLPLSLSLSLTHTHTHTLINEGERYTEEETALIKKKGWLTRNAFDTSP